MMLIENMKLVIVLLQSFAFYMRREKFENQSHQTILGDSIYENATRNLTCNKGYSPLDPTKTVSQCTKGNWTEITTCVPGCPLLNLTNGWLDGNMNTNGSQKRINCNQRHVEGNKANVTMCINGEWTPKPKCIVNDWRLFIGVPKIGGDILDSWTNGTHSTNRLDKCFDENATRCSQHFRDPFVDRWNTIGVQKVNVSLYKNGKSAAFVLFNATGKTMMSWFDQPRIIDSSWSIDASSDMKYFSMEGRWLRRFFILERGEDGCENHKIFMMAMAEKEKYDCDYAKFDSYPQYMYSTLPEGAIPATNEGFDLADKFVIEVYYEEGEQMNEG